MPAWLAPIAGKLAGGALLLLAGLLAVWLIKRSARKQANTEAKAADARLRADAARASLEGYVKGKEKAQDVDPFRGTPGGGL